MKKVVVVVRDERIEFAGDIIVINRPAQVDVGSSRIIGPELLIVKDGSKEVGVFQEWSYWKKMA